MHTKRRKAKERVDEHLEDAHKHVQWVRDPFGVVDHPLHLTSRHS
jgi:hypothetical protein